ncbi:MAG: SemiSWEET transporter [Gammaproteobacteria bacterium]|nr:SemiSWEET transporter [Gammaproteobacteria bacterium]
MEFANVFGSLAGTLTTIAFFPQAIKTWKTKSAEDISLGMFTLFAAGVFLWIVYGIAIGSVPVIIANTITFVLAATILVFKIKYK